MKILSLSVAAAALLLTPTAANAQFFGGFDNSSILGGLAGAGIGGALGSNLAGAGNRDEGTAIGAALGGLAGVAYGNSQSTFGGNPFAGSFNPGFTGNSLLGTAVGAGLGGAIGSNLAGSGVRQEGTAIGALIGGLAGNALTSGSSRYGNTGFGGNGFSGNGIGANSRYGNIAPSGFAPSGFAAPSYGPAFGGPIPAPFPIAGPIPAPFPPVGPQFGGASFVPGGFVNAGTFANVIPAPAPMPVVNTFTPRMSGVTIAAPNVTLANTTRYGSTVTQDYVGSPVIRSVPKVRLRRAPQPKVIVVDRTHYTAPAPQKTVYSISAPAPAQNLAPSGPSIHADTVNINYGDNSQVGTSGSVNGSTIGGLRGSHAAPVYSTSSYTTSASSTPIADLPLAPTLQQSGAYSAPHTVQYGQPGGSYVVNSSQSFQAPSASEFAASCGGGSYGCSSSAAAAPAVQHGQAGGSYLVNSSQSFVAPSAGELAADCASSTFGCAGSAVSAGAGNQAVGYAPTIDSLGTASGHTGGYTTMGANGYSTGNYSFCGSNEVYNDDGALIVGANTVCR